MVKAVTFQFTHPGKGATHTLTCTSFHTYVSIHAPWEGCDDNNGGSKNRHRRFNSRTLGRVRHKFTLYTACKVSFNSRTLGRVRLRLILPLLRLLPSFNSRTLGRVRPEVCKRWTIIVAVSIHAPWEGCDLSAGMLVPCLVRVSIHAPWEGCDFRRGFPVRSSERFQFTHPGKGATCRWAIYGHCHAFQFTHPGKGATA